jgi:hypothetical protein
MNPKVFVPLIGQFDNIGDIILRRELLQWLEGAGELHIYVGNSPADYDASLGLDPRRHVIYRSPLLWMLASIRSSLSSTRGTVHYIFKPGEIQLTFSGLKEHVGMLPAVLVTRLSGGRVLRIGVGSRNFGYLAKALFMLSVRLSHRSFWRDSLTRKQVGIGSVMPDLAFGQGSGVPRGVGDPRGTLVVSLRGDHAFPRKQWIEGLKMAAASLNLSIVAVSQVQRDDKRTKEIADALGGISFTWGSLSHADQERRLRSAYQGARLAVSDRLHVLVAALTEGAVPCAALDHPSDKIERHFEAAGMTPVVVDTVSWDAQRVSNHLVNAAHSQEAARFPERLSAARLLLGEVRNQMLIEFSAAAHD